MMRFRQILLQFYQKGQEGRPQGELFSQAAQSFLISIEAQSDTQKTSAHPASSCTKPSQLFKSSSFVTTLLFSYFLQMVKTGKVDKLQMMLKTMPDLLGKYEKQVRGKLRKNFLERLMLFSEELQFLELRVGEGGMVQWLFHEVFSSFEEEIPLMCELLGSFGEGLESVEKMRKKDYCNLLAALDVSCWVWEEGRKAGRCLGGGETKLFLASKSQGFFPSSQGEYQNFLSVNHSEDTRSPARNSHFAPDKPQQQFKDNFLEELLRLRQEFESNTGRVTELLSFRDCGEGEDHSHI